MTDSSNSSQFSPEDLIEQATGIIMNRFHLDAAQALEVLRRMSQNTRTQMCVLAEQVINDNVLEHHQCDNAVTTFVSAKPRHRPAGAWGNATCRRALRR